MPMVRPITHPCEVVDVTDPRDPLGDQWAQIGHAEKIEWMIETDGYALEVVAPDAAFDPPQAGTPTRSIFPDHVAFPMSSCSVLRRSPRVG